MTRCSPVRRWRPVLHQGIRAVISLLDRQARDATNPHISSTGRVEVIRIRCRNGGTPSLSTSTPVPSRLPGPSSLGWFPLARADIEKPGPSLTVELACFQGRCRLVVTRDIYTYMPPLLTTVAGRPLLGWHCAIAPIAVLNCEVEHIVVLYNQV